MQFLAAGILLFFVPDSPVFSQRIQNTSNGTLISTIGFGTLTPGVSTTPDGAILQFRLRANGVTGYHVRVAAASLNGTPSAAVDGGSTIAASDVGVGITAVATPGAFAGITPRNDVIANGFSYDPSVVSSPNGLTPYTGLASGQATFEDLVNNPGITILSGNQIHANTIAVGAGNFLTVTVKFGTVRQFHTPATFSGSITLEIINGP